MTCCSSRNRPPPRHEPRLDPTRLVARCRDLGRLRRAGLVVLLALILAGCQRETISVYTAPKDSPPVQAQTQHAAARPKPRVSWTLPAGWQETGPGQMSLASFGIAGVGGQTAQVTITQLGRIGGRDVEIFNMWREELGLDPMERADVERHLETVSVGAESGTLFELEGTPRKSSNVVRIVTAMVHRPEASWFYKLAGDAALVQAQKASFVEFLKSIKIQEAGGGELPEMTSSAAPKPNWQVPSHWTELPAGQMQLAKFAVPGRGGAKAEVSVSRFPDAAGGTLANVNRWRRQIGLGEVQDPATSVSALDPALPEAQLVDLANNNRRLVGAIIPREGSYWFYKLLGDAEAVAPEKDAFVRFAQSKP